MRTKRGTETTLKEVLLNNIGCKTTGEINDWFRKSYADGYRLDGLGKVKEIIDRFKDKEIHIMGDYDVDGVMSTSIMYIGLKVYGCKKVFYRTPKRFSEGFGMKKTMIEEINEDDCLIITVDNGIAAHEAVRYAKERGMTVIVTDHHLPSVDEEGNPVYPEADLLVDPEAFPGSADYSGYCGAGIAYKLIRSLIGSKSRFLEPFAAIGTVADVMELREENFVFVKNGLAALPKTGLYGLKALLEALKKTEHVSADDVGFLIGPCINAPGRLIDDGSMKSVELMISDNMQDARRLAGFLVDQNYTRKQLLEKATKEAEKIIETEKTENNIPVIVKIPDVNEGIIGIVASRVMEKYNRPAIIMTNAEKEGELKGSCRAPEGFNVKAVLDRIQEEIVVYGGHEGAAGLTIEEGNYNNFCEKCLYASKPEMYKPVPDKDIKYDIEIPVDDINEAIELIEKFSPHGQGNPKPVIRIADFVNIPKNGLYKTLIGTEGVKLFGNGDVVAVNFHAAKDLKDYEKPEKMVLYGDISYNYFRGNKTPQINFVDFEVVSTINDSPNETPFADLLSVMAGMRN